ncbi:hypothetical protein [Luethyella okanaganae]|uniref:Uridine kinase n=1 Tax=Luethyella okanaganae TaxID=69372 RepID=A0ABW1VGU5_9MICO
MELVSTPRVRLLRDLATEIAHDHGRGRVIVAVDGVERSGKTAFADDLGAVFAERGHAVFRASLEFFHRSRAEQDAFGPDTPERYYGYGFDYSLLRRVLIGPFRLSGSTGFVTRAFDPARDARMVPKWETGPADAVLIVDGRFANRPELRDLWDYSILLDAEPAEGVAGAPDRRYLSIANPRSAASAIVDNHEPSAPRRLLADAS